MPIRGNSKQNQKRTLQSFYIELTQDHKNVVDVSIGKNMLAFIDMVDRTFEKTQIWGLTSLYHLVLQKEDRWDSDWYIKVISVEDDQYHFEYLLPVHKRPWPNATVTVEVKSLEGAKKYLLIAMKECEGWTGNAELEKLLRDNNL